MSGVVYEAEAICIQERMLDAEDQLAGAMCEARESIATALEGRGYKDVDEARAEFEEAVVDARVALDAARGLLERRSQ